MTEEEKSAIISKLEEINPFNIDDNLANIAKELSLPFEEIEALYNEINNKFVSSCKRYKIKENEINTVIYEVLNFFIDEAKSLPRTKIKDFIEFKYDNRSEYSLDYFLKGSINHLKCLHLIQDISKKEQAKAKNKKSAFYKTFTEYWFTNNQYIIHNKKLLKILTPLLVEYVKSSSHANAVNFFEKIDTLFRYVIQPYQNHNENFILEKYLLDNIYETIQIRVIDHTNKSNRTIIVNNTVLHTNIIQIVPISILFQDKEKILVCENDKGETKKIPLNDIIRIIVDKEKLPTNKKITKKHSSAFAYIKDGKHFYITNPNYIKDNIATEYFIEDTQQIILELPLTTLEYFRIKPLANMTLYVTDNEIKDFTTKYKKVSIKPSHFYVVAIDTIENATSIIMHVLSDVQIIEPKELVKSVHDNIRQFSSKHPW